MLIRVAGGTSPQPSPQPARRISGVMKGPDRATLNFFHPRNPPPRPLRTVQVFEEMLSFFIVATGKPRFFAGDEVNDALSLPFWSPVHLVGSDAYTSPDDLPIPAEIQFSPVIEKNCI